MKPARLIQHDGINIKLLSTFSFIIHLIMNERENRSLMMPSICWMKPLRLRDRSRHSYFLKKKKEIYPCGHKEFIFNKSPHRFLFFFIKNKSGSFCLTRDLSFHLIFSLHYSFLLTFPKYYFLINFLKKLENNRKSYKKKRRRENYLDENKSLETESFILHSLFSLLTAWI